jgi:hypothetical protein
MISVIARLAPQHVLHHWCIDRACANSIDTDSAMDRNPYAAPTSEIETPTQGTVSMARYGVLCLPTLLGLLTACVLVSRLAGVPVWWGTGLAGLLAAVQFAHWRFVRTHRRAMSRIELKRFALACAAAF